MLKSQQVDIVEQIEELTRFIDMVRKVEANSA
jgi:hypothetical protein